MGSDNSPYYKAFISYSREEDEQLAHAIQKSVQAFSKPWYLRRSYRVFRDTTNLPVTAELWGEIAKSLDDSEWLIILASPKAVASDWVPKEIEHWLVEHKKLANDLNEAERKRISAKSVVIALTAGTLEWSDETNDFDLSLIHI